MQQPSEWLLTSKATGVTREVLGQSPPLASLHVTFLPTSQMQGCLLFHLVPCRQLTLQRRFPESRGLREDLQTPGMSPARGRPPLAIRAELPRCERLGTITSKFNTVPRLRKFHQAKNNLHKAAFFVRSILS